MTLSAKKIAVIDAHPDPDSARYGHALAAAYAQGAEEAGHEVRMIKLAGLAIPMLQSQKSWMQDAVPPAVKPGQEAIGWADHLVFLYPLWLGDMPALLKAFLEQALRPGFAVNYGNEGVKGSLLCGRSARLVVTMGMPAIFYQAYYGAHSVRSFKRNILKLVGIHPVTMSIIGNVERSVRSREVWLDRMRVYGRMGD
jgi:putative NADPH-quinone reductase